MKLRFFITVFILIIFSNFTLADDKVIGPTYPDIFSPFISVGKNLAIKNDGVDRPAPPVSKDETLYFPETFVRGDDYIAWQIDTDTGDVSLYNNSIPSGLSEKMQQAVLRAPAWLRIALVDRFLELSSLDAEVFSDLILYPDDDRYTDEFAFLVAMMGERDLDNNSMVELLEENVAAIYDYDLFLDYVEVVDYGEPGDEDYYTTVKYTNLVDGTPEEFELPMEIYYWHIVHPKLDHEDVQYVEPETGNQRSPDNGGHFYRSYFMYGADDSASYTTPFFMRNPNIITETMLEDWSLNGSTHSAETYFTARDIYNIDAVYHSNGEPIMVEFAHGKGTVVATTMLMENECYNGNCEMLDNLLAYGCGDMLLASDAPILIIKDDTKQKVSLTAFITGQLTDMGYTDISDATLTEFLAMDATDLAAFKKIIVPNHKEHLTYEAFADDPVKGHPDIYNWVHGGYNVLQLHLGTGDLSDLTFIGGYQVAAGGSDPTDDVTMGGRPLLYDIVTQADHVWDGDVYGGLSGDRPFSDDGTMALRLIGNWAGKNMLDNVAEFGEKQSKSPGAVERAVEPVRIIYNHYGNCGECQDVWTAVLRTCLIPGLNVSDMNEDHVWNEFYHDGEWYYLQNDWSNGATRIATEGGGQDTDYGGGKTTSFIFGWMGNGEIFSVIDRYSEHITFEVNLTDAAGQPVPGARVWIGSEGFYSSSNNWSFFIFTDENGYASTTLGDNRNYYVRIESGAGYWPDDQMHHSTQVIEADDATPGATFTLDHQMDEVLQGENSVDDTGARGKWGARVTFDLRNRFQRLYHQFNGVIFTRYPENLGLNVYVVDKENFDKAKLGKEAWISHQAWENQLAFDEEIFPPGDGRKWYVMLSNKINPESVMTMDVTVEEAENPNPVGNDDDDDDDNDDDGPPPPIGGSDDDDDEEDCCGGCAF